MSTMYNVYDAQWKQKYSEPAPVLWKPPQFNPKQKFHVGDIMYLNGNFYKVTAVDKDHWPIQCVHCGMLTSSCRVVLSFQSSHIQEPQNVNGWRNIMFILYKSTRKRKVIGALDGMDEE